MPQPLPKPLQPDATAQPLPTTPAAPRFSEDATIPTNVGFHPVTAAEIAAAPQLEPALEQLLRSSLISEELIMVARVQGIRETFVSLDDTATEFRQGHGRYLRCRRGPRRKPPRTTGTLRQGVTSSLQSVRVDDHQASDADWMSLVDQFRAKYGRYIHDNMLPSRSYYASFEEQLADGQLCAEDVGNK